ncbi:hypothetical protein Baya_15313 [Bagarius yarrelli]|uniref:Uncharacterized protein n=1 Tax=Bagarius yarrelli TaxID=175774 RepID=A0A556VU31_BAGYA|nr:hypothetical protein Baya_15313 [Bagarius yarrelli]
MRVLHSCLPVFDVDGQTQSPRVPLLPRHSEGLLPGAPKWSTGLKLAKEVHKADSSSQKEAQCNDLVS